MSRDKWQPWAGSTSRVNKSRQLYFGDLPSKIAFRGHPFPRPGPWLEFYGPCSITLPNRDLTKSTILRQSQGLGYACITGCLSDRPYVNTNLIHSVKIPGHQLKRSCAPVCVSSPLNPRDVENDPKRPAQRRLLLNTAPWYGVFIVQSKNMLADSACFDSPKKTLNVDSPSFTPTALASSVASTTISSRAASAAPFTPRGVQSGKNNLYSLIKSSCMD
jgi:hypothetical protein